MATDWKTIDGTVLSSEEYATRNGSMYRVSFNYKVDGSWFGNMVNTSAAYQKGDTFVVGYDPKNPERNRTAVEQTRLKWIVGCAVAGFFALLMMLNLLGK